LQSETTTALQKLVMNVDDQRFFAILELLRRGYIMENIAKTTKIDRYFLQAMQTLVQLEQTAEQITNVQTVTVDQLIAFKEAGFTNDWLAKTWGCSLADITEKLQAAHLHLTYKKINGMTEGNEAAGYYYSVWQTKEPQKPTKRTKEKVLIIGSEPNRIGQGGEIDYCYVRGSQELKKQGYETVLINNNPSTVSTDYTLADALYCEPITVEDVFHVMEFKQIEKVIVQFGGQTAINLVEE